MGGPGSGRPRGDRPIFGPKQICFFADPDMHEWIDNECKRLNCNRSGLLRGIVRDTMAQHQIEEDTNGTPRI